MSIITRGLGSDGSVAALITRGYSYTAGLPINPTAGYQYVLAGSSPWAADSVFDANSTAGDIDEVSLTASPSGATLDMGTDGLPYLMQTVAGRQSFAYREWVSGSSAWLAITGGGTYSTYYINDLPPVQVATIFTQNWDQNIPIPVLILDNYVQDPQGDTLTWTGTMPAGLTIATVTYNSGQPNQRTVQQIQGTITSPLPLSSFVLTGTNYGLKSLTVTIPYQTYATLAMPNFVNTSATAAAATLTAFFGFGINIVTSIITLSSVIPGGVASQTPAPGTLIDVNTTVTFVIYQPVVGTGNMPDVRTVLLAMAQQMLQAAGILVPSSLGYFGTWPITVKWEEEPGVPGVVTDQNPAPGTQVLPNSPVTLTVVEYPTGVVYP